MCREITKDDVDVDFNPQPFMTLLSVLRRTGHDKDAKVIAIKRHREARRYLGLGSVSWFGNLLMHSTCGYGYRPWLAAMWIAVFVGVGAFVFNLDTKDDLVRLKDSEVYKKDPGSYPQFNHVLYSADVLLPVVHLQQKDYWAPNANTTPGKIARLYLPLHIVAGWFFTTLFVVGVTGLIRRE